MTLTTQSAKAITKRIIFAISSKCFFTLQILFRRCKIVIRKSFYMPYKCRIEDFPGRGDSPPRCTEDNERNKAFAPGKYVVAVAGENKTLYRSK